MSAQAGRLTLPPQAEKPDLVCGDVQVQRWQRTLKVRGQEFVGVAEPLFEVIYLLAWMEDRCPGGWILKETIYRYLLDCTDSNGSPLLNITESTKYLSTFRLDYLWKNKAGRSIFRALVKHPKRSNRFALKM